MCDLTKVCMWYEILVKMWLFCIKACVWWFPPALVSLHPHSHRLLFFIQHHFLSACGHFWWVCIACEDEDILTRIKIHVWDGSVQDMVAKPGLVRDSVMISHQFVGLKKGWYQIVAFGWFEFLLNTKMQSQGAEWMLNMTGSELEELIQLKIKGKSMRCFTETHGRTVKPWLCHGSLVETILFVSCCPPDKDAHENVRANLTLFLVERWWSW